MIKKHLQSFIQTLYPSICKSCDQLLLKDEAILCLDCQYSLPKTNFHLRNDNELKRKFYGKAIIKEALALYYYQVGGNVQHLIHQLKYRNRPEVGVYLGEFYGSILRNYAFEFDIIVPIPLHPKKLKQRKYNQAEEFGKGLAKALDLELNTQIIHRNKYILSQTKNNRFNRYRNVEGIFQIDSQFDLSRKHILLVDDVITTGATLNSCIQSLLDIEDVQVSVASIAARID